ncbi:MAG: ABC transporter ATP-binding protein [Oscillospiraceae bacterium]|nr:ABC transporter ATP-binding protein [Oscillospiraceae bacterium]
MTPILEVRSLEKSFGGLRALNGADLSIPAGQIVGLLGPNASGKTTLLKTVAGLLQPTAGGIRYPGDAAPGPDARKTVAFCPDAMMFPRWMRVRDAFTFYKDMYPDYSEARAGKLIDTLGLEEFLNARILRLSKGMRERLILGLTLSRETMLYLLDEPLDGIDPVGKTQIIDAILTLKPEDASILISTHMVKDTERILDSVHFLSKGKVVFSGGCDDIREQRGQTVEQAYLEVFIHEGSI